MIGFLVAWLLLSQCDTPTSWVEIPSMVPACGDEDGEIVSHPRMVPEIGLIVFATPLLPQK